MHSTPPPHRFLVADGPTPEFVRWSVDRACEIRQPLADPTPRRCEQFLRPLRAIGEALRDGRVVDDIAVAREATESIGPRGPIGPINSLNPLESIEPAEWIGFRVSEVAAYYGGLARVAQLCSACPVGGTSYGGSVPAPRLAGCGGWLRRTHELVDAIERVFAKRPGEPPASEAFAPTNPRWYGLWRDSPLEGAALERLAALLDAAAAEAPRAENAELTDLHRALSFCRRNAWSLSVELVPSGRTRGTDWWLDPVCPNCGAPWPEGERSCSACGRRGNPHPPRRFTRLGRRPYLPLASLVGPPRAEQLARQLLERASE